MNTLLRLPSYQIKTPSYSDGVYLYLTISVQIHFVSHDQNQDR